MSFESASFTASLSAGTTRPDKQVPVGRFAPSPSGPLHFGSLLSALASYLDIRSKRGIWLLRIDDLDTPRTVAGSEQAILDCLVAHGMQWDESISRQSEHTEAYALALHTLAQRKQLFFCNCSRQSLRDQPTYPGTCRDNTVTPELLNAYLAERGERSHAVRLRVPESNDDSGNTQRTLTVQDELQRPKASNAHMAKGDYVVFRRDGLVSYQLAVVVDDILTGVNRVIRGADLLPTTARQQQLHGWLGAKSPAWLHLPVVLNQRSTKLSKQAHSQPIDDSQASLNLATALQLLGQQVPKEAPRQPVSELMQWATAHWQPAALPSEQTFSTFIGW